MTSKLLSKTTKNTREMAKLLKLHFAHQQTSNDQDKHQKMTYPSALQETTGSRHSKSQKPFPSLSILTLRVKIDLSHTCNKCLTILSVRHIIRYCTKYIKMQEATVPYHIESDGRISHRKQQQKNLKLPHENQSY